MSGKNLCPICGEVTNSYMGNYRKDGLCKKHATALKNGEIALCSKCGKWHSLNKCCDCEKKIFNELPVDGFTNCVSCGDKTTGYAFCRNCFKKYTEEQMLSILNDSGKVKTLKELDKYENLNEHIAEQSKLVVIDNNNKSKCITCGKQSDGLLFCVSCYHKFKDKELLFRITNCTCVELLEEDYEGRYTCKDGHIVKSKSERDIDNYLFEHGISHAYERELPYGADEKEILHPDFYLPNYLGEGKHVYIEHWGYNENNIQYTKTKKFKMPIYKELGVTLVCTYEKTDMGKIDTVLDRKLNKGFIKENQVNYEDVNDGGAVKKNNDTNDGLPF